MLTFLYSEGNAYLVGGLIGLFIWLLIFLFRSDLRKQLILFSILGSSLALITEQFYMKDYWNPRGISGFSLVVSDLVFGFLGGVVASLYDVFFGKKQLHSSTQKHYWLFSTLLILHVLILYIGTALSHINSIYLSIGSIVFSAIVFTTIRKDLLKMAVMNGLLSGLVYFLLFRIIIISLYPDLITKYWFAENLSGILISKIPIEEIMWAFACGLFFGPAYRFIHGLHEERTI